MRADEEYNLILRATAGRTLLHFERQAAKAYWGGAVDAASGSVVGRNRLGEMLMDIMRALSRCTAVPVCPVMSGVQGRIWKVARRACKARWYLTQTAAGRFCVEPGPERWVWVQASGAVCGGWPPRG